MEKEKLTDVPLHQIQIKDAFWDKYIRLVKDVILPYQWNTLNDNVKDAAPSHCIKNFKIAAGEAEGDFEGAVFQDTDVAKWLEAVAFTLDSSGRDEKLEKLADETIDLIGKAQCEDGYLNTYFTIKEPDRRWTNLKEGHELYTAGHMIEAAVAYYNATGKRKFLDIVSRFADLIWTGGRKVSWLSGASGSRTCSGKIVPGNRTEKIFRPCEIFYRYKRCGRKLFLSGRKERKISADIS